VCVDVCVGVWVSGGLCVWMCVSERGYGGGCVCAGVWVSVCGVCVVDCVVDCVGEGVCVVCVYECMCGVCVYVWKLIAVCSFIGHKGAKGFVF